MLRRTTLACGLAVTVIGSAPAAAQAPSDQRMKEQWAIAPGSVLNLPRAWATSQGAGVVVAVLDSGTRLDHPDLAPNAWTNFGEVPGNGADDDGNGYVDDVHGVDLTHRRRRQDLSDGNGHGTHVAGIIAAAANGRGVVGVAFRARIMTIKVLAADGSGNTARGGGGHPLRRGQRRAGGQPQPRRRAAGHAREGRDRRRRGRRRARRVLRRQRARAISTQPELSRRRSPRRT